MKPLKLQRTTLRNLSESELSDAAGGTNTTTIGEPSLPARCQSAGIRGCDSRVDRCPSAMACPPPELPVLPDPKP